MTNPMHIHVVLFVIGQSNVDHVGDSRDVDTTSSDISANLKITLLLPVEYVSGEKMRIFINIAEIILLYFELLKIIFSLLRSPVAMETHTRVLVHHRLGPYNYYSILRVYRGYPESILTSSKRL